MPVARIQLKTGEELRAAVGPEGGGLGCRERVTPSGQRRARAQHSEYEQGEDEPRASPARAAARRRLRGASFARPAVAVAPTAREVIHVRRGFSLQEQADRILGRGARGCSVVKPMRI
jgi:hypothetical protein